MKDISVSNKLKYENGDSKLTKKINITSWMAISIFLLASGIAAGSDTLSTSNPTPIQSVNVDAGASGIVMQRFQVDCDNFDAQLALF